MLKKLMVSFIAIVALSCLVTSAFASDMFPPSWRGDAGTVMYKWTFDTDLTSYLATAGDGTVAGADFTVGDFGSGWIDTLPGFGTKQGFLDMGSLGTVKIGLPEKNYDLVSIQFTCFEDIMIAPILNVEGASFVSSQTGLAEHVATGGNWNVYQSLWSINPGEKLGNIVLTSDEYFGADLDEVIVDAKYSTNAPVVPEPASIVTLLMGAGSSLFFMRRRRA